MKKINKVTVALDRTSADESVLSYANYFANYMGATKLTSAHVLPVLVIGGIVKVAIGEPFKPVAPALEVIYQDLLEKTKGIVDAVDLEIEVRLVEGRPYQELLNILDETDSDLLVMGKKKLKTGSGITPKRVARHTKKDLLIVPHNSQPKINRIVVAMDFSEHSARAIELALDLSTRLNLKAKPICVNVIDLPAYPGDDDGHPYLDVGAELPPAVNKQYEDFLFKYPVESEKLDCHFIKSKEHNIARTLRYFNKAVGGDLIIMGARGHNAFERFLIGSVAESMVGMDMNVPVYIIR